MGAPDLDTVLAHDARRRAVCAHVQDKQEFRLVASPEIPLAETNCLTEIRLARGGPDAFIASAAGNGYAVVVDPETTPGDLAARLASAGFSRLERRILAVLDPDTMLRPPGALPRFTPVGPSEMERFGALMLRDARGGADAQRRLWFFRARSLLFSACLVESEVGVAAFALFHADGLARLDMSVAALQGQEFVLACRVVEKAWARAGAKGCAALYVCAAPNELGRFETLGFQPCEDIWWDTYVRHEGEPPHSAS